MNVRMVNSEASLSPSSEAGQEVAVSGSVKSFTPISIEAAGAIVSVKDNAVCVTFDGSTPVTAGRGLRYPVGVYIWSRLMVNSAIMIEYAGSATSNVHMQPCVNGP